MHISWLGQTCIKLQTKNLENDITILIDPYRPASGNFPRSFSPDVALFTKGSANAVTLSQNPFVVDTFGEFEIKGIMIYAQPQGSGNTILKLGSENLSIVHLGYLRETLQNGEMEKIMSPDILFVPVGGKPDYLEPEKAAELITALEPRIVIPVGFKCDTDPSARPLTEFLHELGIKPEVTEKKVIIKQKDLPQEEMRLIILEKDI